MVLADPPWDHQMRSAKGITSRHASAHYPVMKLADIKAMPVNDILARDCHLFLWTTWPHLEQALEVMKAWGFKYSSDFLIWVKLNPTKTDLMWFGETDFHVGTGYTSRKNTEVCLLGRRGSPKRLSRGTRELLISSRRQHSRKPDSTYGRIEGYCPGPRLELFSRENRPGWTAWGRDVGMFDDGAGAASRPRQATPQAREETIQRRPCVMVNTPRRETESGLFDSLGLDENLGRED